MRGRIRDRAVPLALSALALVIAFLQRPGWSSSDTKIDLHTDPVRFLGEIASLWTPSSGLGGVESAQYAGYLFPMGPFFALGHALGIGDWVVDRLWLGLLLAVGCWGVVALVRELDAARSALGQATAGLVYLFSPYVVVFANRTTVTLLAYALLPWLVLVARRGLRRPRGWRLTAAFALLVTASGGGVNAAVVALALLAPLAILLYEPLTGAVPWRAAWQFGWRALVATAAASLWWAAPAAAQTAYGTDFLRFTEPAGAIWATTSLSESFRAMGYWISYIGVGFNGVVRPYFSDAGTMLFNHLVVTATLLVPGLALLGFARTRRRRYAAYFLCLVLLGTLIMAIGFPDGTPLRRGATFAYNHFASLRFLRTTYKAGPLVVLGVAGLASLAAEAADAVLVGARRWAIALAGLAVIVVAGWPLVQGRAVDRQVSWKAVPAEWRATAADLDRSLGDDKRAVVLPGQLYAFYRWGGTVDPILPALAKKPVAVRNAVPYGDLRGTDLLWTTDALLQQNRLLPGQLPALLRLMSAGQVVAATDDDVHRSGVADPLRSARIVASQLPLRRVYGPDIRGYVVPAARPLVRLEPRGPLTVVDGGAEGLAAMAATGALPRRAPLAYAADLSADAIRVAAVRGGSIVVTDSNRRRIFVVSRLRQNTGATLGATDPISADAATLDPFAERGSAAQTVAVLHGARSITAPFSPGYSQFPEHRPFAAFDGDPRTAWLADAALDPARRVVTIVFDAPRDIGAIDVLPRDEAGARVAALVVNGRRFGVGSGWAHLPLRLAHVRALSVRVIAARTGSAGAGGLAEVRIPGVHVTESLRPPVDAEQALRGVDLSHANLSYAFSRATGDEPWRPHVSAGVQVRRFVKDPAVLEQALVAGAGDEEVGIDRVISPPATRSYDVSGWASLRSGIPRGCGALTLIAGASRVGLRVAGGAAPPASGRPVRVVGCRRLALASGTERIRIPAATLQPDTITLSSPAPAPVARTAASAGDVTNPGKPGRGSRNGVRISVRAPAWLVLGESYDRGWRASCDGQDLGTPVPLDGYANAWPVEPGCTKASFTFAPQRSVHIAQIISALACLILLAMATGVRPLVRRSGGQAARAEIEDWAEPRPTRMPPLRAALAGVVVGAVLAFCFSLRSGIPIPPAIALVLWRGVPAKPLAVAGGLLLALAVPLDYIVFPAPDFGGYNPGYAGDQVSGHWIAVAAWVLLALALWRVLSTASRRRGGPSAERAGACE